MCAASVRRDQHDELTLMQPHTHVADIGLLQQVRLRNELQSEALSTNAYFPDMTEWLPSKFISTVMLKSYILCNYEPTYMWEADLTLTPT